MLRPLSSRSPLFTRQVGAPVYNMSCVDGLTSGISLTRPQLNLLGMVHDAGLIADFPSILGSFNVSVPAGLDLAENAFGSLLLNLATADQVTLSDLSVGLRNYYLTLQDGTNLSRFSVIHYRIRWLGHRTDHPCRRTQRSDDFISDRPGNYHDLGTHQCSGTLSTEHLGCAFSFRQSIRNPAFLPNDSRHTRSRRCKHLPGRIRPDSTRWSNRRGYHGRPHDNPCAGSRCCRFSRAPLRHLHLCKTTHGRHGAGQLIHRPNHDPGLSQ